MSFLSKFRRNKNDNADGFKSTDNIDFSTRDGADMDSELENLEVKKLFGKIPLTKKTKIFIGVAAVIIVVLGGLVYSSKKGLFGDSKKDTIQTFVIPENEKVYVNGVVSPIQSQDFMPPTNENGPDIKVTNGQIVKKGDVLYVTKNEAVISEVDQLKIQLNNLLSQRRKLLADDPALPAINADISSTRSQIAAKSAKTENKVKANFDGKVYVNNTLNYQSGSQNSTGPLMTVMSTTYNMVGQVSEADLEKITIDKTATVTILSSGKTIKGRVSAISDRPTTASASEGTPTDSESTMSYYNVTITFDTQEDLVNGFHVQATIDIDTNTHKLPASSVLTGDGDESYVFKDEDGVLKKVPVSIVEEKGDYYMVSGELKENDVIIKNPNSNMKPGDLTHPDQPNGSKDSQAPADGSGDDSGEIQDISRVNVNSEI